MFFLHKSRLARVGRLAGVAFLLATLALPTAATPVVSTPHTLAPLPLRQAVRSAWDAHPQSRQTEALLAASQARLDAARRPLYNPEVDIDAEREGIDRTTTAGLSLTLDGPQAHYLGSVMRLGPGDQVKLFDDRTGEWLAEVKEAGRKRVGLTITARLREREQVPDLWLLFAPIKRAVIVSPTRLRPASVTSASHSPVRSSNNFTRSPAPRRITDPR